MYVHLMVFPTSAEVSSSGLHTETTSSSGKISGSYMPLLTDEERSSSDADHEEDEAALKELDFRPKRSHSGRRIALLVALVALLAASTALCVMLGNYSWIYSATPRLSPLTTQRSPGPSHYVPIWHSDPFPGNQLIIELPIAQEDRDALNVTNTFMVMRKAVVEKHWDEGYVMVRLVGTCEFAKTVLRNHTGRLRSLVVYQC